MMTQNPWTKADTLSSRSGLSADYPGQWSVLSEAQCLLQNKSGSANTAEGDAWGRQKADLCGLEFRIPASRNYMKSLTDSVKEAELEHFSNVFYLLHLAWPRQYLHMCVCCSVDQKQVKFSASRWKIIWFHLVWLEFDSSESFSLW